jgi:anti-anti-sigma factor
MNTQCELIKLPTDFSGFNVDKLAEDFDQLAQSCKEKVILDFSATEFIDSSGIGAMVFLYKRIEKKGVTLQLMNVSGQPEKLMKLLRVDKTIAFI